MGRSLCDVTSCLTVWSRVPSKKVSVPGPMFLLDGSMSRGSLYAVGSLTGDPLEIACKHPNMMFPCHFKVYNVPSRLTSSSR